MFKASSDRDCFVAALLAMTALVVVIASEAKQSRADSVQPEVPAHDLRHARESAPDHHPGGVGGRTLDGHGDLLERVPHLEAQDHRQSRLLLETLEGAIVGLEPLPSDQILDGRGSAVGNRAVHFGHLRMGLARDVEDLVVEHLAQVGEERPLVPVLERVHVLEDRGHRALHELVGIGERTCPHRDLAARKPTEHGHVPLKEEITGTFVTRADSFEEIDGRIQFVPSTRRTITGR